MTHRINSAKRKMLQGQAAVGTLVELGSPITAEILSRAGYDFVLVDTQHGFWDMTNVAYAFRSIALGKAIPMARVRENDFFAIGGLLDRGALGIVVPMVNTVEDARAAAYAVRCPPRGGRSAGGVFADFHGPSYWDWVDDEIFLAVQIETVQGLENVEKIMAVDGVDGCWIGPRDLAISMGVEQGDPEHEKAIARVLAACHRTGKVPGIWAGPRALERMQQGFRFVTALGDTAMVLQGAAEEMRKLQAFVGS